MAKQALELKKNDKEFVYNQRKKNLEVRYKELSAAKKLKIEGYKKESEKMEGLDEEIEAINIKNAKIDELIKQLEVEEERIENKEVLLRLKGLVQKNESIKQQQA